jgi:hypothetical protein
VENRVVAYKVLVRKLDGWRPLGRSGHRWEHNIKMIFKKWDGWEAWTGSSWLRVGRGGGLL